MAHVHSYSQRDEDGIFLYDKNKRRIGGPYATEEEATIASKAVSEAMGERPVEDYIDYLQQGLMPQERENLFNAGFGDLEHEAEVVRDPVSKLGYNADVGRAVGLGISQRAGQGFTRQGQYYWGSDVEPEKTDLAVMTESLGYSTREFWDDYKGRMKTGMSYEDWLATGKAIGEAREAVLINLHAHRRGSAQLWAHEYGHRGQRLAHDLELSDALRTREHIEIREAMQDMRDVLYANTLRVKEFHEQAEEIGELPKEEFDLIYNLVLEEDKLANEKLMSQGRSPGPEPDMQPYLDWVEGGKTVEGYKKARRKRVDSTWGNEQSGILGLWNKTIGLFD